MTGYESKYTGMIAEQSIKGNLTCREDGIDWYDFSARMYDSMLPQFNGVDALSEKKPWNSPYAYCGGNPILRVDPTGLYDFEGTIQPLKHYSVIAVFPTNLNDHNGALQLDYEAAKSAGMPLMRVDNVDDLASAMSELNNMISYTDTYTLNSHGDAGEWPSLAHFSIGNEVVNINSDFSSLKNGLQGHNVFIGACNVGASWGNGYELVEKIAEQTRSRVIAPSHKLWAGYKYDGTLGLNFEEFGTINNDFMMSQWGQSVQFIKDVSIDKNYGISWDTYLWDTLFDYSKFHFIK